MNARSGPVFRAEFDIGATVALRVDDEDRPGMVCRITFAPSGELYHVTWGDRSETHHYACELRPEPESDGEEE